MFNKQSDFGRELSLLAIAGYCLKATMNEGLLFGVITSTLLGFVLRAAGMLKIDYKPLDKVLQYLKTGLASLLILAFGAYTFYSDGILEGVIYTIGFILLLDATDLLYTKKRPFWWFAIVIVAFRTFCYDVMYVPSESMTPTLLHGDFILVKKSEFGFNKESVWPLGKLFPYLPTYQRRSPKNGEIVVWTRATDPALVYYVKRAVAISGDTLQMKDGILHINNQPAVLDDLGASSYINDHGEHRMIKLYEEAHPVTSIKKFIIRDMAFGHGYNDNTDPLLIPDGYFAIVGDNRTGDGITGGGSHDSRDPAEFPPMPYSQIIGKPKVVLFSTDSWVKFPSNVSWRDWLVQLPLRAAGSFYYLRLDRLFKSING